MTQLDANCEIIDGALAPQTEDEIMFDYQYCSPSALFPTLIQLLASPTYRHSIMRGLIVSVGKLKPLGVQLHFSSKYVQGIINSLLHDLPL